MGMFDYINYECRCPVCHCAVRGFQSKSGPCELSDIEPGEVSNFYSECVNCESWIEFQRIPSTNFRMTVESAQKEDGREYLSEYTKELTIN